MSGRTPPLLHALRDSDVRRLAALTRFISLVQHESTFGEVSSEDVDAAVRDVELLPQEVRALFSASRTVLNRTLRCDYRDRLEFSAQGWRLPKYSWVSLTRSENTVRFFNKISGGQGFFVSGRDILHDAGAIDCGKFGAWLRRTVNRTFIEQYNARFEEHGRLPVKHFDKVFDEVGDDEDEVIVFRPVFRTFSADEHDEGRSRNVPADL